ncbi:MAG TPA: hypothetical protein VN843_28800, partial [Anaerolineales bacterium]|nr:hypothetical protein [Anaerolineales bacterium]
MATVTGLTAERMLTIEGASVVSGEVVGDNLILTKHDGSTIDAGDVRGPAGAPGAPADLSAAVILAPTTSARNVIQSTADGASPLVLKARSSQSADLFQAQNNSGSAYLWISNVGNLVTDSSTSIFVGYRLSVGTGSTPTASAVLIQPTSASTKGLILQGAASQTGNLLELQNSAATALASVTSAGKMVATSGLQVPTGATSGYYMTSSDGSGNVTWTAPT